MRAAHLAMSNPQLSACLRLLGTPQDPNHAQAVAQLEAWESQSACELICGLARLWCDVALDASTRQLAAVVVKNLLSKRPELDGPQLEELRVSARSFGVSLSLSLVRAGCGQREALLPRRWRRSGIRTRPCDRARLWSRAKSRTRAPGPRVECLCL